MTSTFYDMAGIFEAADAAQTKLRIFDPQLVYDISLTMDGPYYIQVKFQLKKDCPAKEEDTVEEDTVEGEFIISPGPRPNFSNNLSRVMYETALGKWKPNNNTEAEKLWGLLESLEEVQSRKGLSALFSCPRTEELLLKREIKDLVKEIEREGDLPK